MIEIERERENWREQNEGKDRTGAYVEEEAATTTTAFTTRCCEYASRNSYSYSFVFPLARRIYVNLTVCCERMTSTINSDRFADTLII